MLAVAVAGLVVNVVAARILVGELVGQPERAWRLPARARRSARQRRHGGGRDPAIHYTGWLMADPIASISPRC